MLKAYGRIAVMIVAITQREPDVTPEITAISTTMDVTFRRDKALRDLGYRIQPRAVAIRYNYDWLVEAERPSHVGRSRCLMRRSC